jgi:L-alanine-DL-glutamate epimerase-like enolase superfamily enzyme
MSEIISVSAKAVSVPLDAPTSLSTRLVTERHYGLVKVETRDAIGIGFCYVGNAGGTIFPEVVSTLLAPLLIGRDSCDTEGLWADMYQQGLLQGRAGIVLRAISALDIAFWDCNSRSAGRPLYKYLGAMRNTVPAYASGGYYLDGKGPEKLADEMQAYVEAGYTAVKMKVGRLDLAGEEARIRAVRERIGPSIILMLDANNAWSDFPTALRFARMYEDYSPHFLEEPFSPDDITNHARLAQATRTLIATGEIEVGRWRFAELLRSNAAAILQTDACVCGGITEFRRIAATASSFGITLCPHWFHDVHAHLVAATPNADYVEFFPDDQVLNFRRLVDRQIQVTKGHIELSQEPGLGFEFETRAVERFSLSPWHKTLSSGRTEI